MKNVIENLTAAIEAVNDLPPIVKRDEVEQIIESDSWRFAHPQVMATFLRHNLTDVMQLNPNTFNDEEKLYWVQVAQAMNGTAYINKMRKVAAFMGKVMEF